MRLPVPGDSLPSFIIYFTIAVVAIGEVPALIHRVPAFQPVRVAELSAQLLFALLAAVAYRQWRGSDRADGAAMRLDEVSARFMDNLPGVAFIKDSRGRYIYSNRGAREFYRSLGIADPYLKKDEDIWPEDVSHRLLANDQEVVRAMKPLQVVERVTLEDGSSLHFLLNKFPLRGQASDPMVCGVGFDITELKNAEKELADLLCRQQAILDNIPDPAWLKNLDGEYITVNKAFEKVIGMPRANVEGKSDFELWPETQARHFDRGDRRVISFNGQCKFEELLHVVEGEQRWYETYKQPLRNDSGEIIGTAGIARDISDRKQAERELHRSQEQLSALAAELSLAEERERRKISSELHDQIGQNLAIARIKVNLLEQQRNDEKAATPLAELKVVLDDCIKEVRSLTLQISPPLLYEIGFEPAVEWLGEWIKDMFGLQVELRWEGPSFSLDDEVRGTLFRVLRELLINCGKHAGTTTATVVFRNAEDAIDIVVSDSGVGFDPAAAEAIRQNGGFGLFNIRQRISHLGGRFIISTAPGLGTTVAINLPLPLRHGSSDRRQDGRH